MLTYVNSMCYASYCCLFTLSFIYVRTSSVALFDTPDEPESTIEATLVFIGAWSTVPHEGNTSIWSKRVTLEEPATGYRFRFTPLTYKNAVAMQVQLHGCPVCNIGE